MLNHFAAFLMEERRESRGLPALLQAMRHPQQATLWVDYITEDLPHALAAMGATQQHLIRALVEDATVDQYVRAAGLEALASSTVQGHLSKAELLRLPQPALA